MNPKDRSNSHEARRQFLNAVNAMAEAEHDLQEALALLRESVRYVEERSRQDHGYWPLTSTAAMTLLPRIEAFLDRYQPEEETAGPTMTP